MTTESSCLCNLGRKKILNTVIETKTGQNKRISISTAPPQKKQQPFLKSKQGLSKIVISA